MATHTAAKRHGPHRSRCVWVDWTPKGRTQGTGICTPDGKIIGAPLVEGRHAAVVGAGVLHQRELARHGLRVRRHPRLRHRVRRSSNVAGAARAWGHASVCTTGEEGCARQGPRRAVLSVLALLFPRSRPSARMLWAGTPSRSLAAGPGCHAASRGRFYQRNTRPRRPPPPLGTPMDACEQAVLSLPCAPTYPVVAAPVLGFLLAVQRLAGHHRHVLGVGLCAAVHGAGRRGRCYNATVARPGPTCPQVCGRWLHQTESSTRTGWWVGRRAVRMAGA